MVPSTHDGYQVKHQELGTEKAVVIDDREVDQVDQDLVITERARLSRMEIS